VAVAVIHQGILRNTVTILCITKGVCIFRCNKIQVFLAKNGCITENQKIADFGIMRVAGCNTEIG